jgi:predicted Zn finger-like uncharacterized protein
LFAWHDFRMSLATRCPVCQTVFRVVQDQLKVSEGWVRCGRCAKVFNAFEGLFDLEREFPALRASTTSATPSQRVLEDLARRNRQPEPQSPSWEEDFDTRATVRDPSASGSMPLSEPKPPPASPAASPAAPAAAPIAARPRPPMIPAVRPNLPAPTSDATTAFTGPQETVIATGRVVRPQPAAMPVKDDNATVPPMAARAPAMAPAKPTATPPPAPSLAPPPPAHLPAPIPAPLSTPIAAPKAAPAAAGFGIRAEPKPVPGTAPADSDDQEEQSFEALFRSDGELAEPATATDGVDIVLDGADIEPASLDPDDAVDSRLLTFVQQADKAERWRRPWVRAAMVASTLVLALLLGAQLVVARRDSVVAHWPESRSWVQSLCAPFGCRIEPLRRIDQLSVDSSGLTRIDDGPVYRLALVLHNRGETQLLVPAIDLSLTDASGTLVTRRMMSAAELGASRTTIAAGQELPLQALLMSAERPLTGYTIEIFYP